MLRVEDIIWESSVHGVEGFDEIITSKKNFSEEDARNILGELASKGVRGTRMEPDWDDETRYTLVISNQRWLVDSREEAQQRNEADQQRKKERIRATFPLYTHCYRDPEGNYLLQNEHGQWQPRELVVDSEIEWMLFDYENMKTILRAFPKIVILDQKYNPKFDEGEETLQDKKKEQLRLGGSTKKKLDTDSMSLGHFSAQVAGDGYGESVSRVNQELLTEAMAEMDAFIGQEAAKKTVKEIIALIRFEDLQREMGLKKALDPSLEDTLVAPDDAPSYHLILAGDSGTGKTMFARILAKIFHALGILRTDKIVSVRPADMIGDVLGNTEKNVTDIFDRAMDGVLFLDEAHQLGPNKDCGVNITDPYHESAIRTMVPLLFDRRHRQVVIMAGYLEPIQNFLKRDEGLGNRMPTIVPFTAYTHDELGAILDKMIQDKSLQMTTPARKATLDLLTEQKKKDSKRYGNARAVLNMCGALEKAHALRLVNLSMTDAFNDRSVVDRRKEVMEITLEDVKAVGKKAVALESVVKQSRV